jgi:hypothetical protein
VFRMECLFVLNELDTLLRCKKYNAGVVTYDCRIGSWSQYARAFLYRKKYFIVFKQIRHFVAL